MSESKARPEDTDAGGPDSGGPDSGGTNGGATAVAESEETERQRPPSFGGALIEAIVRGNSAVVTILAIVLALVVGAILIVVSDQTVLDKFSYFTSAPGDALSGAWHDISTAYAALFKGSIVDPSDISSGSASQIFGPISHTITNAIPLIFGGLSVSMAFKAGLFNIGAQGQLVAGAIAAGWAGFDLHLPIVIHLIVAIACGIAGGAIWGGIAGFLKARFGAHEVIVTIMLNYVGVYLLTYLLTTTAFHQKGRQDPISKVVDSNATLPHLGGPPPQINLGILLALAAAFGMWWLLSRSRVGFRIRSIGLNPAAARTAGTSVPRMQLLAMLIAGGLAGMMGVSQLLGTANATNAMTTSVDAGLGFTAITVALLGRTDPLGTVLAALLFGALTAGGSQMQAVAQVPNDIITVVQNLIVLFVAAPPLVRTIFRMRGSRRGGEGAMVAKSEETLS